MARHPHFVLDNISTRTRFTSTRSLRPTFNLPARDRAVHGPAIVTAFQNAQAQREQFPKQVGNGFYQSPGLTLSFESEPQFPLAFESLDLGPSKIRLLSVVTDEQNRTIATVHVPEDKIPVLLRKLEAYRDRDPENAKARDNKKLVESISNIRLATLRELWTDSAELYPVAAAIITWEVWLRRQEKGEEDPPSPFDGCGRGFRFRNCVTALAIHRSHGCPTRRMTYLAVLPTQFAVLGFVTLPNICHL